MIVHAQMRQMIIEDEQLSTDEKMKRLESIDQSQQQAQERREKAIKENRENVSKVALEIFKGFLTCGISFVPAVVNEMKKSIGDKQDREEFEALVSRQQLITGEIAK